MPAEFASLLSASPGKPALEARWTNLLLLTYEAPERLLRRFIHPALELDRWNGQAHVSLVAFDFEDTRLFGYRLPGYANFPEVNLRTYVQLGRQRGVVFIRELVPSRVIAAVARAWYNEPYQHVPLTSRVEVTSSSVRTERCWQAGGRLHEIHSTAGPTTWLPDLSTVEDHFKEHEWGFRQGHDGRLRTYRVEHPRWPVREIVDLSIQVCFATTYGGEWEFLDGAEPVSTIFAEGSEVVVYAPTIVG